MAELKIKKKELLAKIKNSGHPYIIFQHENQSHYVKGFVCIQIKPKKLISHKDMINMMIDSKHGIQIARYSIPNWFPKIFNQIPQKYITTKNSLKFLETHFTVNHILNSLGNSQYAIWTIKRFAVTPSIKIKDNPYNFKLLTDYNAEREETISILYRE